MFCQTGTSQRIDELQKSCPRVGLGSSNGGRSNVTGRVHRIFVEVIYLAILKMNTFLLEEDVKLILNEFITIIRYSSVIPFNDFIKKKFPSTFERTPYQHSVP